jgi:hypothetical protein
VSSVVSGFTKDPSEDGLGDDFAADRAGNNHVSAIPFRYPTYACTPGAAIFTVDAAPVLAVIFGPDGR